MAAKIPHVTALAKRAIQDGKCVVIGLLSTGEAVAKRFAQRRVAQTESPWGKREEGRERRGGCRPHYAWGIKSGLSNWESDEEEGKPVKDGGLGARKSQSADVGDGNDEDEEGKEVKVKAVGKTSGGKSEGTGSTGEEEEDLGGIEATLLDIIRKYVPDAGMCQSAGETFQYAAKKAYLIDKVKAQALPQFPLDDLIQALGGHTQVAEITGRKCRLERNRRGELVQVSRAKTLGVSQKRVNIEEMRAFQAGRKLVAIISDAGSTGISLHADRRAQNKRRRVHMTLEIPYNSSSFVQQLGRSHRSNQVSGVRESIPGGFLLSSRFGSHPSNLIFLFYYTLNSRNT